MASPAVNVSTGASITFSSGFFAQILDINLSGINRAFVETTHMGTTAAGAGKFGSRTFMPVDLDDPGTLEVEIHFNPDTRPPIGGSAETVTLTIPGSTTPATFAGSAFMTDCSIAMPLEDKMVMNCTLKWSGNITVTAGT